MSHSEPNPQDFNFDLPIIFRLYHRTTGEYRDLPLDINDIVLASGGNIIYFDSDDNFAILGGSTSAESIVYIQSGTNMHYINWNEIWDHSILDKVIPTGDVNAGPYYIRGAYIGSYDYATGPSLIGIAASPTRCGYLDYGFNPDLERSDVQYRLLGIDRYLRDAITKNTALGPFTIIERVINPEEAITKNADGSLLLNVVNDAGQLAGTLSIGKSGHASFSATNSFGIAAGGNSIGVFDGGLRLNRITFTTEELQRLKELANS